MVRQPFRIRTGKWSKGHVKGRAQRGGDMHIRVGDGMLQTSARAREKD